MKRIKALAERYDLRQLRQPLAKRVADAVAELVPFTDELQPATPMEWAWWTIDKVLTELRDGEGEP